MKNQTTVFHITHPKAGSQWVTEVLKHCAPERTILPQIQVAHFCKFAIKPGGVYPAVYVSRVEFETIMSPAKFIHRQAQKYFLQHPITFFLNWFHFQVQKKPYIKFVVIRDLRDTLVSLYFSFKVSHPQITKRHVKLRDVLNSFDKQQGLLFLMDNACPRWANNQLSWVDIPDILLMKYEELLADEYTAFERIIDYCHIELDRSRLHEIIHYNSFEVLTGRKKGQEDRATHQRKAIIGDWRNHFSEQVKEEFKRRFGDVLISTGYEKDMNW